MTHSGRHADLGHHRHPGLVAHPLGSPSSFEPHGSPPGHGWEPQHLPAADGYLLSSDEHYLDLTGVLSVARALREQADWDVVVRESTEGDPFAETVLFLLERLDVIKPA